jgi:hypothetical protein
MGRANLGQLLGNIGDPMPASVVAAPALDTVALNGAGSRKPPAAEVIPPDDSRSPSYLRFVRKDTRLREDQLEALTTHARRLTRARRSAGVRITENTLIRVAVDLLLDRIGQVSGDDESGLLGSVLG